MVRNNQNNNDNHHHAIQDDSDNNDNDERVIIHFDLDAFYVACERELNETLRNVPVAVSQYNPYGTLEEKASHEIQKRLVVSCPAAPASNNSHKRKYQQEISSQKQQQHSSQDANGSLIAVSYEARAAGVKRNDRGLEAVRKCPTLSIVQVPVKHGKADLTLYRTSSSRVMDVLTHELERQSKRILLGGGVAGAADTTATASASLGNNTDDTHDSENINPPTAPLTPLPVEVASIDEVYVDVTKPAHEMVERIMKIQKQKEQERRQRHNRQHPYSSSSINNSSSLTSNNTSIHLYDNNENANLLAWEEIVKEASKCTTIGGIEQLSDAALAANALNKDEVRRGSKFQVLDSSTQKTHLTVDEGSQSWWQRPLDPNDDASTTRRESSCWTPMEIRLAIGAYLASKARKAVLEKFEGGVYTLSAGISSNKTLAKLASGLKKPNRQTLINRMDDTGALKTLFHPLPLGRIRGLGGKFGDHVSKLLNITTVGQLATIPLPTLISTLASDESSSTSFSSSSADLLSHHKTARFLYDIAQGVCHEEVTPRTMPKSIACGKTFRGKLAIATSNMSELQKWTKELCSSLIERLTSDRQEYNRFPTVLCASVKFSTQKNYNSKQVRAPKQLECLEDTALQLIIQLIDIAKSRQKQQQQQQQNIMILGLCVSVSQFVEMAAGSSSIMAAFQRSSSSQTTGLQKQTVEKQNPTSKLNMIRAATAMTKKKSVMDRWLTADTKQMAPDKGKTHIKDDLDRDHIVTSSRIGDNLSSASRTMDPNTTRKRRKPMAGMMEVYLNTSSHQQKHALAKESNLNTSSHQQKHALAKESSKSSVSLPTSIQNSKPNIQKSTLSTVAVTLPTLEEIDPAVLNELPEDLRKSLMKDIGNQQRLVKKPPQRTSIQKFFGRAK